jgi:hypothetical protein
MVRFNDPLEPMDIANINPARAALRRGFKEKPAEACRFANRTVRPGFC